MISGLWAVAAIFWMLAGLLTSTHELIQTGMLAMILSTLSEKDK